MKRRRKPRILPKLRPYGTRQKHCAISWTDRYIAIYSYDIYGGSHFSPEGIATHRPRDAITPVWLGKTTRDALLASRFLIPEECFAPDVPLNRERRIALEVISSERRIAFWDEIAATYGYEDREAAWNRDDLVFGQWFYETEPDIILSATKLSMNGGHHTAWPASMEPGRVFHVPFAASDAEIGETVLKAFAKCEGPGRSKRPIYPLVLVSNQKLDNDSDVTHHQA